MTAACEVAERARASVLEFFHASERDYTVAFTASATGALELVGEAYPFEPDSRLVLTADNHNSVNGIRELARVRSSPTTFVPVLQPELKVDTDALRAALGCILPDSHSLFAYPAQSNVSGVQHPLEWIAQAKQRGWDVLLDAAAFVSTNRLDLTRWQPDFVPVSFYRLFGYPTGGGCLIARREALARLRWPRLSAGTIDVLGLPAVEIGLRELREIGIDVIHARVQTLTAWLLDRLTALQHPNCAPLVRIYGPTTPESRGGTVAFNVLTRDGQVVHYHRVEEAAAACNVSLRSHEWGMLRASVGSASTAGDINRLVEFVSEFVRSSFRERSDCPCDTSLRSSCRRWPSCCVASRSRRSWR